MNIVDVKQFHQRSGKRVYGWQTVSATAALELTDPKVRCPECKGAVGLYSASFDGRMPDRAEHRPRNPGCSLGDCFNGVRRQAVLPIEPIERATPLAPLT